MASRPSILARMILDASKRFLCLCHLVPVFNFRRAFAFNGSKHGSYTVVQSNSKPLTSQQKFRAMNGAHLASPIRGELGYAHWPQLGTQFIALLETKFGAH